MIWQQISQVWQYCIEEAWDAYCHGSLPHGAVVVDAEGNIVARGRNRIREQEGAGRQFAKNRLAHAEMNALMVLDWQTVNVYGCTLYSLIEPCPMCIGAVRMAHMRGVHYAVRDGGAGGTSLIDKTPFFKSGNLLVSGPAGDELELVLMALQVEATLSQSHPSAMEWIEQLAHDLPIAIELGTRLSDKHLLTQWKEAGKDASFVVDHMHEQLLQLNSFTPNNTAH
ncbi:MAG TPA: nucleoside deaminase [Ktedonobacteraceae bacterium]|nr:nucleoside deaminase [Ktedonobacteraceae bacterium]